MHFKVYSRYFYSRLDENGKRAYDEILDGWLNYRETVTISGLTGKVDFSDVISAVREDNPELFYVDHSKITMAYLPQITEVRMKLRYTPDVCENLKKRIAAVADKVAADCKRSRDPERFIHDYLCENVIYANNRDTADDHCVKGPLLEGKGVCEGFAKTFKLLCDAAGIPCIVISGTATNSEGQTENHAWNIVRHNGSNYHVDVTWNRSSRKISDIPVYYNVSDSFIGRNHFWDGGVWPACTVRGEVEKGIIDVTGMNSLKEALTSMLSSGRNSFILGFNRKFSSGDELMNVISQALSKPPALYVSFSAVYYENLDCAYISFKD